MNVLFIFIDLSCRFLLLLLLLLLQYCTHFNGAPVFIKFFVSPFARNDQISRRTQFYISVP